MTNDNNMFILWQFHALKTRSKRLQHSGQMQPFCRHLKWKKNLFVTLQDAFFQYMLYFSNRCMFYMAYRRPKIIVVI